MKLSLCKHAGEPVPTHAMTRQRTHDQDARETQHKPSLNTTDQAPCTQTGVLLQDATISAVRKSATGAETCGSAGEYMCVCAEKHTVAEGQHMHNTQADIPLPLPAHTCTPSLQGGQQQRLPMLAGLLT